jgi:hypothetical protein
LSGLLERIARRRRQTASRRLGPPPRPSNGRVEPVVAVVVPDAESPPEPPPTEELALPELEPEPEPEAEAAFEPEPEREPEREPEPEPEREPEPEPARSPRGFVLRGRTRRRARYLRQLREMQLRDIGGFVLELHRFGRERPDLLQAKLASAEAVDRELRALERKLGERTPIRELREPGLGGACPDCGAVHGSADRFCASCGERLR